MVGPGLSAAAEERQRKLQEYLAAKGKLKIQNTKPYLKAKNNCPNPPPSKSTIRPKRAVTSLAVLPAKATRPLNTKPQPRPANTTGPRGPKSEPPKLVGKRPTSRCVSSNPNCKASSQSQQQHKAGPPAIGELSRKPRRPPSAQGLTTVRPQVTSEGHAKCTDSVASTQVGNKASDGFLKETDKENWPQTSSEPERKPDPELSATSKPETNSSSQAKRSLAPKQVLGKSSANNAVLKDGANKQLVGKTQARTLPLTSQRLSGRADVAQPGEKLPRTVPTRFIQTLSRTQTSKKPVVKDIKVNRDKYVQPYPDPEQNRKHKPRASPGLLQGERSDRHLNVKQDRKAMQPRVGPQTACVLQKSRATSQRPKVMVGSLNPDIPRTPGARAKRTNISRRSDSCQQKAQTLDSKLRRAFPQNHFLSKTAPKTQAGVRATNGRGVPHGAQTNPDIKKKATADDRRKQLEEWQKSKGKIYKRPPMELKTKRKIIEEMNISFWKSIEKEEEEKKSQWEVCSKIDRTLTECLRLIEEGVLPNEIFTILSSIPEAEKFAKFWICKAKLLASKGTFDVIGLYEEAIKNGATPIQELREVVLNILQDTNRTTEDTGITSAVAETNVTLAEELVKKMASAQSCPPPEVTGQATEATATPQIAKAEQANHPGIKLQIAPVPRVSGMPDVQDVKLITPVRRSARIERAVARYPEMLQEHDVVVASLDELLEVEETECFIFRKNEALPVRLGFEALEL